MGEIVEAGMLSQSARRCDGNMTKDTFCISMSVNVAEDKKTLLLQTSELFFTKARANLIQSNPRTIQDF